MSGVEVIADHGASGLRHRRVASVAGVPLGSTTYDFASLEDLLVAASERAVERDRASRTARFARVRCYPNPEELDRAHRSLYNSTLPLGGRAF